MLKLKLQYFGHLMGRVDSLEKTMMLGKIEGERQRGYEVRVVVNFFFFSHEDIPPVHLFFFLIILSPLKYLDAFRENQLIIHRFRPNTELDYVLLIYLSILTQRRCCHGHIVGILKLVCFHFCYYLSNLFYPF